MLDLSHPNFLLIFVSVEISPSWKLHRHSINKIPSHHEITVKLPWSSLFSWPSCHHESVAQPCGPFLLTSLQSHWFLFTSVSQMLSSATPLGLWPKPYFLFLFLIYGPVGFFVSCASCFSLFASPFCFCSHIWRQGRRLNAREWCALGVSALFFNFIFHHLFSFSLIIVLYLILINTIS